MEIEKPSMRDLVIKVQEWAKERGVDKLPSLSQKLYMVGELCNEFRDAVNKNKPRKEIMCELGDVYVFAINWLSHSVKDPDKLAAILEIHPIGDVLSIDHIIDDFIYHIYQGHKPTAMKVLSRLCKEYSYDRVECLCLAVDKITKRKTRIQNGKAVKEEDL